MISEFNEDQENAFDIIEYWIEHKDDIVITVHPKTECINGLLCETGETYRFKTEEELKIFLNKEGLTDKDYERYLRIEY